MLRPTGKAHDKPSLTTKSLANFVMKIYAANNKLSFKVFSSVSFYLDVGVALLL